MNPREGALAARIMEEGHKPDPWGVKRAENLLKGLQGIQSARMVVSSVGEIIEIHVLAGPETSPKQVVRNVESALLAHLGLKVDPRKISVAQTAPEEPLQVVSETRAAQAGINRPILFTRLEVVTAGPNRIKFTAHLDIQGEEVTGEALSADAPSARLQASARSAILGLEKVMPGGTFELEGVTVLEAFGKELVVVGLHAAEGRSRHLLVGAAGVNDSTEPAAVLAVLDATNRWLGARVRSGEQ